MGKNQNYIYRDITVKKLFLIVNIALLAGLYQWWCVLVTRYSKSIGGKVISVKVVRKLLIRFKVHRLAGRIVKVERKLPITLQSSSAGRPCCEGGAKLLITI